MRTFQLAEGFAVDGTRVPLIGRQGIFKPAILPALPLSITTVPVVEGKTPPYADEIRPDGLLRYRYRDTDSTHRDNVGLRLAMARQVPLIYLVGLVPGQYMPVWARDIVHDDRAASTFSVAVDEQRLATVPALVRDPRAEARRARRFEEQRPTARSGAPSGSSASRSPRSA